MNRKPLSKKIRFRVFQRDNFTCQYCGRSAPEVELHVDHIRSVANGGDNDMENLITACKDCNLGKGKHDAVLQKQMTVSPEMRPLLKYLTDDEIDDITTEMECLGLDYMDFRTVLDAFSNIWHIRGWIDRTRRKDEKVGSN